MRGTRAPPLRARLRGGERSPKRARGHRDTDDLPTYAWVTLCPHPRTSLITPAQWDTTGISSSMSRGMRDAVTTRRWIGSSPGDTREHAYPRGCTSFSQRPTRCGPETCTAASASRASSTARSASCRRMPSSTAVSPAMEHVAAAAARTPMPARMRGCTAAASPDLRAGGGGDGHRDSDSAAALAASRNSAARSGEGDHVGTAVGLGGSDSSPGRRTGPSSSPGRDSVSLPSSSSGSEMEGDGRRGWRGGGVVGAAVGTRARGDSALPSGPRGRSTMGGRVGAVVG